MNNERVKKKSADQAYIEATLHGIQQLKNDLVSQIAHEFRTPLTSVIGFAEMLLADRPLTDSERIEYARFIQYEGIRLSKLIDDLLELASLERPSTRLEIADHSVQDAVLDAVARVSEFAQGRVVTVQSDMPSEPLITKFDRQKIMNAVYQLLHNAVRFTKSSCDVIVRAIANREYVEISVQDRGPGIPSDEIAILFNRFGNLYRPESDPRGTGVGLAIVKTIVDLHGGEVLVQSRSGEGSTFTIRIPHSP